MNQAWPALPYSAWRDTLETVHRMTQIVGKIRLARMPMMDGWWQVPLYVTARGLTTSPMPAGDRTFQLDFDFLTHELKLTASDGTTGNVPLTSRRVARFYAEVMTLLDDASLSTPIRPQPVELPEPNPVPLDQDLEHATYDPGAVTRFFRALALADQVFKEHSAGFAGRISPVAFFWGTFDLAVSRYSGRVLAEKPGQNIIERYAFDREQIECGFWPGDARLPEPAFYAFAVPPPEGYADAAIRPSAARFDSKLSEFVLPYEAVRESADPRRDILDFLKSTYEAGARPPHWDRVNLDWRPKPAMKRAG